MNTALHALTSPAAMADHFDAQADEIHARYNALTDAEKVRYVVECDGMLINVFGGSGLGQRVATLETVPTYGKYERALAAAERVVNGAGVKGKVVTLGTAYLDTVAKYRDIAVTVRNANGII